MKDNSILTMLAVLLSATLSSSCNDKFGPDDEMAKDTSSPVSFVLDHETKGTRPIDDEETLGRYGFGVFAGYTKAGDTFGLESQADNYIRNMKVNLDTKDAGRWKPATQSYWPVLGKLSFFGYAPYFDQEADSGSGQAFIVPSKDYKGGMLRGTYKPDPNVTSQLDLCLSIPRLDRTSADGPVPMTFKHALTRVFFLMNGYGVENELYRYRVTDIDLTGVVGMNNFTFVMDEDVPYQWDPIRDTTARDGEYHMTYFQAQPHLTDSWVKLLNDEHELSKIENFVKINNSDNGRLYLIPQQITSDARLTITVTAYTRAGVDWEPFAVLPAMECNLPVGTAWEPGKTTSYCITLDIPHMRVLNVSGYLADWEDSSNIHERQLLD